MATKGSEQLPLGYSALNDALRDRRRFRLSYDAGSELCEAKFIEAQNEKTARFWPKDEDWSNPNNGKDLLTTGPTHGYAVSEMQQMVTKGQSRVADLSPERTQIVTAMQDGLESWLKEGYTLNIEDASSAHAPAARAALHYKPDPDRDEGVDVFAITADDFFAAYEQMSRLFGHADMPRVIREAIDEELLEDVIVDASAYHHGVTSIDPRFTNVCDEVRSPKRFGIGSKTFEPSTPLLYVQYTDPELSAPADERDTLDSLNDALDGDVGPLKELFFFEKLQIHPEVLGWIHEHYAGMTEVNVDSSDLVDTVPANAGALTDDEAPTGDILVAAPRSASDAQFDREVDELSQMDFT